MEECKTYCIYKHTSPSGKVYIGQTKNNPNKRWLLSGAGYKRQNYFWNAICKYGWDSFTHEIIKDNLTKNEANNLEKELIKEFKNLNICYNITDGGEGSLGCTPWNKGTHGQMPVPWNKGVCCSDEIKEKISKSKLGHKYGKQTAEHIANKIKARLKVRILQFEPDGRFLKSWDSAVEIEKDCYWKPSRKAICACCRNKTNSVAGFIWIYEKDFSISTLLDKIEKYEKGLKHQEIPKVPVGFKETGENDLRTWLNTL